MRKAKRQMDAPFALEVFDKAPYITVSMTRPDGTPYGLPPVLGDKVHQRSQLQPVPLPDDLKLKRKVV